MNKHIGSDFDDFLDEDGLREEAMAAAVKRVIAWQIAQSMKAQKVTKTEMAARMAKGLGLEHTTARLTADPGYNVAVGSAYLRQMLDEFGPSVALIASGYNAGPGRPRRWRPRSASRPGT